ncbi:hypothetical protein [Salinirubrum litoreum]|uniref:Uncharacterized protein n=1 Tax=Salinirubrum litoreum TaxID=1126234 RepID=A0ABD5R972_9EURY|nr:hypothetical protein [Salinirubrum litoreum]
MNESDRRLAALTFAALVFGLSFAGGFYTQASLSDQEAFSGGIGAAANFSVGNDDGGTAGNDDGGTAGNDDGGAAGNDDGCVGNTGNTECGSSASVVSPGSGVAAPTADRRPLPAR